MNVTLTVHWSTEFSSSGPSAFKIKILFTLGKGDGKTNVHGCVLHHSHLFYFEGKYSQSLSVNEPKQRAAAELAPKISQNNPTNNYSSNFEIENYFQGLKLRLLLHVQYVSYLTLGMLRPSPLFILLGI